MGIEGNGCRGLGEIEAVDKTVDVSRCGGLVAIWMWGTGNVCMLCRCGADGVILVGVMLAVLGLGLIVRGECDHAQLGCYFGGM
jgi:hypothetical protein